MKTRNFIPLSLGAILLASCGSMPQQSQTASSEGQKPQVTYEQISSYTPGWSQASKEAARLMVEKHGEPLEKTEKMLIWRNVAPFKRIVVYKDSLQHKFPFLHQSVVEHTVDYSGKGNKIDEVWDFNGSVVLNRTAGEMSARSDQEAMNILALNLAHEIQTGQKNVDDARLEFGRLALENMNQTENEYTKTLIFGSQVNTSDAGESIVSKINWDTKSKKQAEEEDPKKK
jgi:hypothetical protein